MPYASNPLDACRVYFEEDGSTEGPAVVIHGGLLDCVDDVRDSGIVKGLPRSEYRLIYVDHRGLGRSDKPFDGEAYAMRRRVADVVAVLDALRIERAHFIGMSWGGRLGYGIGEHASDRVLSLVCGGQQPYAWPDSPLTRVVTAGLASARTDGTVALVRAFEEFWKVRFPEPCCEPSPTARGFDNHPTSSIAWLPRLCRRSH